jgi:hypothetical protein
LSREIARAHNGDITFNSDSPSGWTEFVVTLPVTQRSQPSTIAEQIVIRRQRNASSIEEDAFK